MFRRKTLPIPEPEQLPTSRQIDEDLEVIYGQEDGQSTDFSKLEVRKTKRGRRLLVWLLITLAILCTAAYGGYIVFEKAVSGSGETLILAVEGPNELVSGQEVDFDVSYQNIGSVPLATLEIKLNLPKGFILENTDPAPTGENNVWTLGAITAGSDGLIHLKGVWIDSVPSGQTLQALATYRPANFNADFQKIATKTVTVTSSVLTLTSSGPTTGAGGGTGDYVFTLKNTGERPVEGVRLRLTIPSSFLVSAADPKPMEGAGSEWQITNLDAGAETSVKISGSFAADGSGLTSMAGSLGVMRDQDFLQQATSEAQTDLVGGGLTVRLIVNGSTTDQTIDPGSTLRLSIDVSNGSEEAIDGLAVTLIASTESKTQPIDWPHASLGDGDLSVNTITWSGDALSKSGALEAGERETIDLNLPLLAELGTAADQFTLGVTATVSEVAGAAVNRSLQSTPLTVRINSNTNFSTDARYFEDGTPVGTGPLPPAVGQTTRYRLRWNVSNTLHALDALSVSATIPPGVNFDGSASNDMGAVVFDATSRLLTWTIDRLPTSVTSVSTSFNLSVTPTTSDVGSFIKLMNASTLTATDSATGARIEKQSSAQTTEIPNDTEGAGKGAVVE